jgi:hypothetical protein
MRSQFGALWTSFTTGIQRRLRELLEGYIPDKDSGQRRPFRQALYEALVQRQKEGKL